MSVLAGLGCLGCGNPNEPGGVVLAVSSVTPNTGSTAGGTVITITGSNFVAGVAVTVGGVAAADVTVTSSTSLKATTRSRAAGLVDVTASANGRSATLPGAFTYVPTIVINTPPTIQSVTTSSARAEADTAITLNATVQDAETPVDQLVYQWSASPSAGVFAGSGRSVTWTAPHQQPTPAVYTLTLTVTENYMSGGQPRQNVVSSSVQVHYNDSAAELTYLGTDFLVTKFGNYDVSPQQCVSNFSDSCPGKAAELNDITGNRQNFHILDATYSVSSITFNSDKTSGTVVGPCVFTDIIKASGAKERVSAICTLTGVYENFRWFLCDSHAVAGPGGTTPLSLLRGRVPARID